jgi:hypothetical protein
MIFSLTKKFLFIANLKSASTSIENVLGPYGELRLSQSQHGKHLSFSQFAENFPWLLNRIPVEELFVFGVIREPVDYALSVFNFHRKEDFRGRPNYTGDMSFEQFISTWVPKHADQLRPQISRFLRKDQSIATNLLISHDRLQEGLDLVAQRLDIPELTNLPRTNQSPIALRRDDLSPDQIIWIERRLRKDTDAISRYANRIVGQHDAQTTPGILKI